jgi:hypothetical protein
MVEHGEIEGLLSDNFRMKNVRLPLESGRSFHDEDLGSCRGLECSVRSPSFCLLPFIYCRVFLKSSMFYLLDQRREHVGQRSPSSSEDG